MSAVVTLRTVWMNSAADPSDWMSFRYMASLSVDDEQGGEVRQMANGRRRLVRRAGRARSAAVSLPNSTREQVAWLEAHVGELVCVRDDRGRKFFGVYLSLSVEENRYNSEAQVSLSVQSVSHSEAV